MCIRDSARVVNFQHIDTDYLAKEIQIATCLLYTSRCVEETVRDLLLVAVKPEYQNKGVNALLFSDLIPVYQKLGFIFAESNPELELEKDLSAFQT